MKRRVRRSCLRCGQAKYLIAKACQHGLGREVQVRRGCESEVSEAGRRAVICWAADSLCLRFRQEAAAIKAPQPPPRCCTLLRILAGADAIALDFVGFCCDS